MYSATKTFQSQIYPILQLAWLPCSTGGRARSRREVRWVCVVVPAMPCVLLLCLSGGLLPCPVGHLPEQPMTLSAIGLGRKEYLVLDYFVQVHLAPKNYLLPWLALRICYSWSSETPSLFSQWFTSHFHLSYFSTLIDEPPSHPIVLTKYRVHLLMLLSTRANSC